MKHIHGLCKQTTGKWCARCTAHSVLEYVALIALCIIGGLAVMGASLYVLKP